MPQLAQQVAHCTQVHACTPAPDGRLLLHRSADMLVRRAFGRSRYGGGQDHWLRLSWVGQAMIEDEAGMPPPFLPAQPCPGSHPSRLLPKSHLACIAQVCLAGSTTIDEEVTDYFKDTGWGALLRHS